MTTTTINFKKLMLRGWPPKRDTCTAKPKGKQGVLVYYDRWAREWPNVKWKFKPFGYKSPVFTDGASFGAALERRGFKKLGQGHFSAVYAKPDSDRVIKVNHQPDNWVDYAHWAAQQGFAGGLSPMIYSYKKIKGVKGEFQVSIVERMERVIQPDWRDYRSEDKKSPLTLVPSLMHSATDGNEKAKEFLQQLVPGLGDFLSQLQVKFKDQRLDLHGENIMLRKDGSVCVTDPVCSYEGSTIKRLRAGDFTPALALRRLFESNYRHRRQWS